MANNDANQEGLEDEVESIQSNPEVEIEFALTPGQLKSGVIIDYSTTNGRKLYKSSTEPLQNLHDLSAENLRDFLKLLEHRANIYDWNTILEILNSKDDAFIHLLRQYGSVTMEEVREDAKLYVNKNTRAAQDSQQLADCIFSSLTVEARNSVTLHESDYTIKGRVSGTCLLKVVIRESHIDTNATTRIIREELNKLDTYMVSIDSDVVKFNEHVKNLLDRLQARGGLTEDLLSNIFRAYKVVSDKDFVEYINKKKDEYDEGKDINAHQLMLLAANKFKTKKQEGEWNAPSEEQEQIIALKAEVNKLKHSRSNDKRNTTSATTKPGDGNKSNKKTIATKTPTRQRKPAWMKIPPKEGEPHKKAVNGKDYHWCPKHEAWGRHLPADCEGKGYVPPKKRKVTFSPSTKRDDAQAETKKLKVANALLSLIGESE